MGRYYYNRKATVEECKSVGINWLKKHNYLNGYRNGGIKWKDGWGNESSVGFLVDIDEKFIKFFYTITDKNTGEKKDFDYKIQLTTTVCNYGGQRYWFICSISKNGIYCGRRVGKLYLGGGSKYFACRHCLNLSYNSRNVESVDSFRFMRRLFRNSKLAGQVPPDLADLLK